ncbi:MAG TPA: alpha/beta hydrolase [Mycobacteriales bacterium]|nr:alpha/beta hydrolase [Mycobacteriales bacterium]
MDPELAALIPYLPASNLADPIAARHRIRDMFASAPPGREPSWLARVGIEQSSLPAADGYEVPTRIYRPLAGDTPRGAMVHFHGGAFVAGDLDISAGICGRMADAANIVVVDVDYRLAPEHPFPVGFEDCYSALLWTAENADALGVDLTRLAVGGESAGGALAAAVAIAARDRNGPALAYQQLIYAVLDDALTTGSIQQMKDAPLWDGASCAPMWEHYLGPPAQRGEVSPYAAPARAVDTERGVAGLPPAYLLACEHDPLRDEEIAYAVALLAAGVSVELHLVPGTFHGFDGFPTHISKRTTTGYLDSLRRAIGPS